MKQFLTFDVFLQWTAQKHSFTFDKVFVPNTSQEDVFIEISQLVQSALDGYKVTKNWQKNIMLSVLLLAGLVKADVNSFGRCAFLRMDKPGREKLTQ